MGEWYQVCNTSKWSNAYSCVKQTYNVMLKWGTKMTYENFIGDGQPVPFSYHKFNVEYQKKSDNIKKFR